MVNKRALLSFLICRPWAYPLMAGLSGGRCLRILAYHRVLDIHEPSYPFDNELISASVHDFDRQMEHVASHWRVMTFSDAGEYEKNGEGLPERSLIITFDDGYADNYENAFPILEKYGLKAVFFLSTDYIGTNRPFWFERLVYLVKKGLIDTGSLRLARYADSAGRDLEREGPFSPADLHSMALRMPNRHRLELLREIEERTPQIPEEDIALVRPLTWDQVREMAEHGMEIGSHTQSHLILGNSSPEEAARELALSRKIIEDRISRKVSAVSYPIASLDFAVNPIVLKLVEFAGYRWGVAYTSGSVRDLLRERYMPRRLKIERYVSFDRFRAKLLFPSIFA